MSTTFRVLNIDEGEEYKEEREYKGRKEGSGRVKWNRRGERNTKAIKSAAQNEIGNRVLKTF